MHKPSSAVTQADLDSWIDLAYAKIQAKEPEFKLRPAQVKLSKDVAGSFLTSTPLAVEAPTGTGKTLAYLLGALAFSEVAQPTSYSPIVVATATKALQQQLVATDLPRLVKAGISRGPDIVLAKGKSNYMCLTQAHRVQDFLERAEADPDVFLESDVQTYNLDELTQMLESFDKGQWSGDFDLYEGPAPKRTIPIAVRTDTCSRKKCTHYSRCAYYQARGKLVGARVIVANHDLVLRDMWMTSLGTEGTLPVAEYRVIFDEAHHLPEKAIKVGASEAQVTRLLQELPKIAGAQRIVMTSTALQGIMKHHMLEPTSFDTANLGAALDALLIELEAVEVDEESGQHRFAKGEVPAELMKVVEPALAHLQSMLVAANSANTAFRDATGLQTKDQDKADECQSRFLDFKVVAEEAVRCFAHMGAKRRYVKWLFKENASVTLNAMPLEASDVLNRLLWTKENYKCAVMISATLRDLGTFNRFTQRTGLPHGTQYSVLPYSFPYEKSVLKVPAMKFTPKPAERRNFVKELMTTLPREIVRSEGTLILAPSWSMLRELAPVLKSAFGMTHVKVQGEAPVRQLVQRHQTDIDRGQGSILLGVATMSEGLDLPGKYCTHVAILALPFAVPTDPVEQELSDLLGSRYFSERSLPDAVVKLTQMAGRLIRRETDVGRITIFDRRVASTSYGAKMLKSLPPFNQEIVPLPA